MQLLIASVALVLAAQLPAAPPARDAASRRPFGASGAYRHHPRARDGSRDRRAPQPRGGDPRSNTFLQNLGPRAAGIRREPRATLTDADGRYEYKQVPAGAYVVIFDPGLRGTHLRQYFGEVQPANDTDWIPASAGDARGRRSSRRRERSAFALARNRGARSRRPRGADGLRPGECANGRGCCADVEGVALDRRPGDVQSVRVETWESTESVPTPRSASDYVGRFASARSERAIPRRSPLRTQSQSCSPQRTLRASTSACSGVERSR